MRARSNCIFVQLSISGRIHHHPHYLHSAPRTKLCYSIIETRESRCLKGRLLCSLPHCIPNAPASGIVDLHQIQALIATLPGHVTCALLLRVLFKPSLQAKKTSNMTMLQILYTDELVRMSSSLLAGLGVTLDEGNLYSQLLTAVKDKQLGRDVVTNHQ